MKRGIVLLADSHSPMLEGVRSLLEESYESVVMVANEKSLLQAPEKLEPELAIVDVSLPVATGRNVVVILRERFPQMKLVVLSVHDDPVAVQRIMASGAAAFVLKRTATMDLLPALQEVSAGGVYISPAAGVSFHEPHEKDCGPAANPNLKKEGLENGCC